MDTIALADLAPILAAVLGPMLAFAVLVMRYQHLDSIKTRDLIERSSKESRDLIRENRDLIEDIRKENRDGLREVNRSLADARESLSDARERLARIEGHFGIGAPHREDADEADAAGTAGAADGTAA